MSKSTREGSHYKQFSKEPFPQVPVGHKELLTSQDHKQAFGNQSGDVKMRRRPGTEQNTQVARWESGFSSSRIRPFSGIY